MNLDYKDFNEQLFGLIPNLLYEHNKLVLPYFGAFVANYCPAQVLFGVNQIAPAKKQLIFDPEQINNDNIFINAFALANGFDHNTAQDIVNQWIESISGQLLETRVLDFEKVGLLYFNNDAKLELKQSDTNFWKPSAGLPTLAAVPIIREKSQLPPPVVSTEDLKTEKRTKKSTGWSANKIALFGFLGIGLVTGAFFLYKKLTQDNNTLPPIAQTDSTTVNNVFSVNSDSAQNANVADTISNSNPNTDNSNTNTDNSNTNTDNSNTNTDNSNTNADNSNTNTDNSNTNTNNSNTNTDNSNPKKEPSAGSRDYVIVVGAFSDPKNAKRMRRRLEKEGYFIDLATTYAGYERIGVQISCSPSELKEHLKDIRQKFSPKAWVLK